MCAPAAGVFVLIGGFALCVGEIPEGVQAMAVGDRGAGSCPVGVEPVRGFGLVDVDPPGAASLGGGAVGGDEAEVRRVRVAGGWLGCRAP
jgi:hypothetical protein